MIRRWASVARWLALLALSVGWARLAARLGQRALQLLQQEGYLTGRYLRWWARRPVRIVPRVAGLGALAGAFLPLLAIPAGRAPRGLLLAGWAGLGWWLACQTALPPNRKPLVLTARVRRLMAGQTVTGLGLGLVAARVGGPLGVAAVLPLASAVAPLLVAAGNLLLFPVEACFRRYYRRDAAARLRRYRPTVVAVAGSYGKTSTKEFLSTILAERFELLKPPGSHNTPLGLARVIREQLTSRHELFVAELGDWAPGDIAELCRLLQPTVGVLVNVGPEHLERFGTLARIEASKLELLEALPADGLAVVNQDDPVVRRLAERGRPRRIVRFGQQAPGASVRARNVRTTRQGLAFTVETDDQGSIAIEVRLLGRHNVENLLAAIATALALGLTLDDVARAVRRIHPVEHRLQPINGAGGVLIVDDAFNSNPRGAAAALEVLRELPGGQKILVTPGIVELGDTEYQANRALGELAAAVCDVAILVGRERSVALVDGLHDGGFPDERIHVVGNLGEATARLATLVRAGDVVLFENDLPDTYADAS